MQFSSFHMVIIINYVGRQCCYLSSLKHVSYLNIDYQTCLFEVSRNMEMFDFSMEKQLFGKYNAVLKG